MLREALKKTQRSAQEPPIASQVKECEEFIARTEIGPPRTAEAEVGVRVGGGPESIGAVACSCRGCSAKLRLHRAGSSGLGSSDHFIATDGEPAPGGARLAVAGRRPESAEETSQSGRGCRDRRPGFLGAGPTDAKGQWMQDRQAELQGSSHEVLRVTQELAEASNFWFQRRNLEPEASNPGLSLSRLRRVGRALQIPSSYSGEVVMSSDEESLVPGGRTGYTDTEPAQSIPIWIGASHDVQASEPASSLPTRVDMS